MGHGRVGWVMVEWVGLGRVDWIIGGVGWIMVG